ncbi:FUSC family protein [Actinoallomurus acaciae]|uniref:Aromatic acid exporter family protein n=1 Tax=Actinoallomurus acaciae TaxID=502577 RepID=A0ABV5Y7U5_9ACTN
MRRWAIGLRRRWSRNDQVTTAVKATIAAVCAWIVARYLAGHRDPYFAPISALVSVQATVVRSVREGVSFAVCFALGVVVAVASAEFLGPGLLSLTITLLAGALLGGWRGFGAQGIEVPFTATFVLLLGGAHPEPFVLSRLVDVAVGVPIGIAVNAFLLAPLHLRSATDALDRTADDIAALLTDMADGLAEGWPVENPHWYERSQALDKALRDTLGSMSHAHESLRLNPRGTTELHRPRLHERLWDCFADIRGSVQSIAHSLDDASAKAADEPDTPSWLDEGFRAEYGELLRKASLVIGQRLHPAPRSRPGMDETQQALLDLRQEVSTRPERSRAPWYTQSHLVIELNRILTRVCDAIDDGERFPASV